MICPRPPLSFPKWLFAGGLLALAGAAGAQEKPSSPATVQGSQSLLDQIIRDSQKHAYTRRTGPEHVLRQAEAQAAGLAGDIAEYNDWMVEIILRWTRAGEAGEASYLADNLPGSGPARAHLEIAAVLIQEGRRPAAGEHLKKARETIEQARGRKAEILRTRQAELLYRIGQKAEADTVAKALGGLASLELEARLQALELGGALTLAEAQARLAQCEERGVDKVRASFLLACAARQLRAGHQAAGMELLREAGRLSTRDGLPSAQHLLVEVAGTAYAAGEFAEADKAIKLYLEIVKTYADAADWKVPYIADALELLHSWKGREPLIQGWLKAAEASLPKVFILDAPRSILALARVAEKVGGPAEADRLVLLAARAGAGNQHPRGRAAAAVQICLYYADAGRPVPAAAAAIMNSQPEASN